MKNGIVYLTVAGLVAGHLLSAQSFTNSSSLIPQSFKSGGVTGVTDVNNDGRDDIIIMDKSTDLYIAYQQANGQFQVHFIETVSSDEQWGMCVGDIDNDGHGDVMCGGHYDGIHVININSPVDFDLSDPGNVSIFMQACNFADINNDGWLDGFACHDDGFSHRFRNDGTGVFVDGNDLFDYDAYPGSDGSGNYGSQWSDFDRDGDIDLMVAKCRQFVSNPLDPRRTNLLFVNDGLNNYVQEAPQRGLVNLQQSWTSDFADVDNDGDFDCFITTHSGTLELYENNGLGYFTNITAGSGLEISGFFLQGKLADFDNDGFVDILFSGGDSGLLRNNGDKTFTEVTDPFPGGGTVHAFGLGDLNRDGWVDVYANYGVQYNTPGSLSDRLYLNNSGSHHWIAFDLEGTISNRGATGALVEIHGPWGIQIREVRSGESYGITNSAHCMFGLGADESVDFAVIHWPSGVLQVIESPQIDTYHAVMEMNCAGGNTAIAADGSTQICEGTTVAIHVVNPPDHYLWNTGSVQAQIQAENVGRYALYVYDPQTTCAYESNAVNVTVFEDFIAGINWEGDLDFCRGEERVLTATAGESYLWSNGEDSQSIVVTDPGDYFVTVSSPCGSSESSIVSVFVYETQPPVVEDVYLDSPGAATLNATGDNVRWYLNEGDIEPTANGNQFITPDLTESSTFWVDQVVTFEGEMAEGGKMDKETSDFGQYHTSSSYWNVFDAYTDFYLETVKVFASVEANRRIQLIDQDTQVLQELQVLIPEGESYVNLDFFVPQGTEYGLRISGANPQLWRDRNVDTSSPFAYPYALGELGAITGTNVGSSDWDNYYYFFYDWTVRAPDRECVSERDEVNVIIAGIGEETAENSMTLFPNPASADVNLTVYAANRENAMLEVVSATGSVVKREALSLLPGENTFRVAMKDQSAGIYMVHLRVNENSYIRKVILEK